MTSYERWTLFLSVASTFILFGTLAFIAAQVFFAARAAREAQSERATESLRRKREATLDYWSNTLFERHRLLNEVYAQTPSYKIAEVIKKSENDKDLRVRISRLLGYYEMLATGVNLEIYDLLTIKRLSGAMLVATFDNYKPFIDSRRIIKKRPNLYSEFETLIHSLKDLEILS